MERWEEFRRRKGKKSILVASLRMSAWRSLQRRARSGKSHAEDGSIHTLGKISLAALPSEPQNGAHSFNKANRKRKGYIFLLLQGWICCRNQHFFFWNQIDWAVLPTARGSEYFQLGLWKPLPRSWILKNPTGCQLPPKLRSEPLIFSLWWRPRKCPFPRSRDLLRQVPLLHLVSPTFQESLTPPPRHCPSPPRFCPSNPRSVFPVGHFSSILPGTQPFSFFSFSLSFFFLNKSDYLAKEHRGEKRGKDLLFFSDSFESEVEWTPQ